MAGRKRRTKRTLLLLLHALVLSVLMFADEPVYRAIQDWRADWSRSEGFVHKRLTHDDLWEFFASFGLWTSAVAVAAIVWQMDARRRPMIAVMLAGLVLASTLTSVTAKTVGRMRPRNARGFSRLMPFGHAWVKNTSASLPSGHATFAGAMAAFLTLCYPKLRGFAWTMAVGCGLSRIYFTKHFPSDVYAGFLVGHYTMLWVWARLGPLVRGLGGPQDADS